MQILRKVKVNIPTNKRYKGRKLGIMQKLYLDILKDIKFAI
jgi:hypothetical protein